MTIRRLIILIFWGYWSCHSAIAGQVSVFEDLLYWRASEQSTSLWVTVQPLNNPPGYVYPVPNTYFKWSPGIRLGLQYQGQSPLDFKAYWTHFSTRAASSIIAPPGHILIPVFFNGFTTLNLFNAAQLDWKLRMDMFDVEMGHQFYPLETLGLRPFIGIKGGSIKQRIGSTWQAIDGDTTIYSATENVSNDFYGLGPSFGLDTTWTLYPGLAIRGDVSTALLWGRWSISDVYNRPGAFFGFVPPSTISSDRSNTLGSFMARIFLGLEWSFRMRTLVSLKAGYEVQFWSNQLRIPLYQQLPVHGDLTLQGLTCGILIDL